VVVALVTLATFTDGLAYFIAVPVLPDMGRRFGASPTLIGLLFASFGLTLLLTSIPMGAVSDRTGRRLPLVGGLVALAASSAVFAFAPRLSWLFAARLMLGVADATTWVVGFAVVADLYTADERGRMMGFVVSGSTAGLLLGPTVGGWLYQTGGPRLPNLAVALCALVAAGGLAAVHLPPVAEGRESVRLRTILGRPAVMVCAVAVAVGGGTIAMLEPVLSLHLASAIGLGPARIGMVFGAGALVAACLHPVFGRLADRLGGRQLSLSGLGAIAAMLPALLEISSFASGVAIYGITVVAISMMVAPSLAYMADVVSASGSSRSFGAAYGLFNFAWAFGILIGPSIGATLYDRVGISPLLWGWAPVVIVVAIVLSLIAPQPVPLPCE
jgi:MFS transporter, DHA1 family, solute carrier family 18 (vesicular amine transporter), member 1/2